MGKKRKNAAELPENLDNPDTWDNLKCKNEELEAEKLAMMARILELETTNKDLEQEIRRLKENCTCPQDTAGNFRIVPLLAMRKIFEFLSFDDLKELRCVSSWFFTTILDEFESVFGTYHIKMRSLVSDICSDTGKKWILQVPKEIDEILRPEVELAFNLEMWDETGKDMGKPDADFVQEIQTYKNNITEIKVALCHDSYDYLLKEDFYFKHLEKIDIVLVGCKSKDCHNEHTNFVREACNNIISRYANQLENLKITGMHDWDHDNATNSSNLPHLPNMKSLSLHKSWLYQASFVMKSVNFENVTKLDLYSCYFPNIDIKGLKIKNLTDLRICDVDEHWSERLLKNNSSTLTTLNIGFTFGPMYEYEIDIKDIKFSKLKQLNIGEMYETDAFTLIENSKNSIEEIYVSGIPYENKKLESVRNLQLPRLKKVHLDIYNLLYVASSQLVTSLISACNDRTIILIRNKKFHKSMLLEHPSDKFISVYRYFRY